MNNKWVLDETKQWQDVNFKFCTQIKKQYSFYKTNLDYKETFQIKLENLLNQEDGIQSWYF